jgi:hypothetical protein
MVHLEGRILLKVLKVLFWYLKRECSLSDISKFLLFYFDLSKFQSKFLLLGFILEMNLMAPLMQLMIYCTVPFCW